MGTTLAEFVSHISYVGIIVFLIGTGVGFPIPEEVPIIAAGVLASSDQLNEWLAYAACLFGALVGDCALFGIGYYFGHNLAKRHPRIAQLLHAEHEAKIEQLLQRHGLKLLFTARFLVGIRGPIYLTVGILRMKFLRFLLVDAVCATAVVTSFFWLSYAFGAKIAHWIHLTEVWLTVVVLAAAAVVGIVGVVWLKRRWMAKLETGDGPAANPPAA